MSLNDFRLFVMDMEKALLAQTGRPFVRMQIESGCQYIIDNAEAIVSDRNVQDWTLTKTVPPKTPNSL